MKLKKISLTTAVVVCLVLVDLGLNIVSMLIIGPDWLSDISFVILGVSIVALGLPSYLLGKKGLWVTFALVSAFLNISFVLESTRLQSSAITAGNDTEIVKIDKEILRVSMTLESIDRQYTSANNRTTLDQLDADKKYNQKAKANAQADRKNRLAMIENGKLLRIYVADDIFMAIPRSAIDNRWIQLVFWGVIFIGMQRAIVVFGVNAIPKKIAPTKDICDLVDLWVKPNWAGKRSGASQKIINKDAFDVYFDTRGGFDTDDYKKIKQAAIDTGVISPSDDIIIKDELSASEIIKSVLKSL